MHLRIHEVPNEPGTSTTVRQVVGVVEPSTCLGIVWDKLVGGCGSEVV